MMLVVEVKQNNSVGSTLLCRRLVLWAGIRLVVELNS